MIVISVEIYCNLNILKISFNLMSNIYTTLPAGVVPSSHHSYRNKVYCGFGQVPLRWEKVGFQRWNNVSTLKQTSEYQRWSTRQNFNVATTPHLLRLNKVHRQLRNNIGHLGFKQREGFYFYSITIKIQRRFKVEVRHCLTLVQRWIACWEVHINVLGLLLTFWTTKVQVHWLQTFMNA